MAKWSFVARSEDVTGAEPHHVSTEGVDAALIRVDGDLRAFQGLCPHQGALLGEGEIVDGQLVCRNHRWCFDADTGERDGGPQCLEQYPIREVDGRVELDLDAVEESGDAKAVRRREDLPGPDGWPVVGSALQMSEDKLHQDLENWAREYGTVYRYDAGPYAVTVTAEPEMMADAFQQRPETFHKLDGLQKVFDELGILGVFAEEGEPWRRQRRLVMGALNPRRLRDFFPTLRQVTERLLERWERAAEQGRTIEVQSDMMRFTIDVTTQLAFAEETNTIGEETNFLIDNLDPVFPKLMSRLTALVPYWRILKLPSDRRVERGLNEVRDWLSDVIERTRAELEEDPERADNPRNFLEAMLAECDADGEPYDEDVIFGNAMTMLLAGEDTTANTLSWAVHLLLDAPEAESSLRDAIDEVLDESSVPASMSVAGGLEAVEAVANESMRLKPVAPFTLMTATEDTVIGDLAVEEGTTVACLTRVPGLDPDHVEDPERFDPSRWDDPKMVAKMQRSGTFMPFGSGPRMCPGRSLALLEIRMVLATLYRNFEVERVGESADVEEMMGFTMTPKGLRVKLHKRG